MLFTTAKAHDIQSAYLACKKHTVALNKLQRRASPTLARNFRTPKFGSSECIRKCCLKSLYDSYEQKM